MQPVVNKPRFSFCLPTRNKIMEPDASASTPASPAATPELADMLAKMAAYVEGEAEISVEDYRLLQSMNLAAAERYGNMAEYSAGLVTFAERLQSKCDDMMPQLAQACAIQSLHPHTIFL